MGTGHEKGSPNEEGCTNEGVPVEDGVRNNEVGVIGHGGKDLNKGVIEGTGIGHEEPRVSNGISNEEGIVPNEEGVIGPNEEGVIVPNEEEG